MNDEKYDRRFDESRYPEFMKKIIEAEEGLP